MTLGVSKGMVCCSGDTVSRVPEISSCAVPSSFAPALQGLRATIPARRRETRRKGRRGRAKVPAVVIKAASQEGRIALSPADNNQEMMYKTSKILERESDSGDEIRSPWS